MSNTWQPIETAPTTKGHVFATHPDDWPAVEVLCTPFFMHNGEIRAMNQNSGNLTKIKHYKFWAPLLPEPPGARDNP